MIFFLREISDFFREYANGIPYFYRRQKIFTRTCVGCEHPHKDKLI